MFWHGLGELLLVAVVVLFAVRIVGWLIGLAAVVLLAMLVYLVWRVFLTPRTYWQPLLPHWLWVLFFVVLAVALLSSLLSLLRVIAAILGLVLFVVVGLTIWSGAYRSNAAHESEIAIRYSESCEKVLAGFPADLQALRDAPYKQPTEEEPDPDPELDYKNANDIVNADVANLTGGPVFVPQLNSRHARCLAALRKLSHDPVARFTYKVAADGRTVTFHALSPKGDKLQYNQWVWGDRYCCADGVNGQTQQHRFSVVGTYNVTLTQPDIYGRVAQATVRVVLSKPRRHR